MHYSIFGALFLGVALLLVVAKLGGVVAERWGQPPVLGELVVGVLLGNLLLPFLGRTGETLATSETLGFLAEIGVLILLFQVGLEVDVQALARAGPSSALVAVIGVAVPIALGWATARWFMPDGAWLVHLFVGATLAATSVGITARVLRDLGADDRPESHIILGAAIVDDVLGLIVLAVVTGLVGAAAGAGPFSVASGAGIVLRALLFLVVTLALSRPVSRTLALLAASTGHRESMLVLGLALCFVLAWAAETIGLAAIIGAFAAGVMVDPYGEARRPQAQTAILEELLRPLAALFVPLFFVLIGLRVDLTAVASGSAIALTVALVGAAIAGKLACGFGVVTPGASRLAVAIGMIPRGEVGLVFAGVGATLTLGGKPVLSGAVFSAVILMVLVTTLVAPPALAWAFGGRGARR
jgi:Kef-type K+ transport system membrane component KefB